MRKMINFSIAVLCTGILLSGIGTGVAIAEYMNLEYTGRHDIGAEHMKQESFDTVVIPVEGKKIMVSEYYQTTKVVYDEAVPMNTIRYKVNYNPELVSIRVRYEEERYDDQDYDDQLYDDQLYNNQPVREVHRYQGTIRMNTVYFGSGFDLFMKNKDSILSELKQSRIGSYEMKDIENVELCMNPQMKEWVEIN